MPKGARPQSLYDTIDATPDIDIKQRLPQRLHNNMASDMNKSVDVAVSTAPLALPIPLFSQLEAFFVSGCRSKFQAYEVSAEKLEKGLEAQKNKCKELQARILVNSLN